MRNSEDETGTRERQDGDDARCGGGGEQGGGTSGADDDDRDRNNYYDLCSLLVKIELRICPDFRSNATRGVLELRNAYIWAFKARMRLETGCVTVVRPRPSALAFLLDAGSPRWRLHGY